MLVIEPCMSSVTLSTLEHKALQTRFIHYIFSHSIFRRHPSVLTNTTPDPGLLHKTHVPLLQHGTWVVEWC